MLTLIGIEVFKLFKRWRTYIGFIVIAVLIPVILIALKLDNGKSFEYMTRNLQQSFIFIGNFFNAYFISYMILNSLTIHIPFLVTLASGDLLAGEATSGTYRILLTRPVSRFKILTAKFFAGLIYTNLLVLWLAIVSLGLGLILFGVGELIVIRPVSIVILERSDILWRFVLAYGYASLCMSVVASLAFLFSSLVENSIGPIITTMAIIIAFIIISAIDIDIFQKIKPFLFTNYIMSWRLFFDNPMDYSKIINACIVLIAHILIFYSAALYIFKKKDILS